MHWNRAAGAVMLLAVLVTACARPIQTPSGPAEGENPAPTSSTPTPPTSAGPSTQPPKVVPHNQPSVQVMFKLFDDAAGVQDPSRVREQVPGDTAIIGTGTINMEIVPTVINDKLTIRLDGAPLVGEIKWDGKIAYSVRIGPGKSEDKVTVTVEKAGVQPAVLSLVRAVSATATVDQSLGETWQPVTILNASAAPGPASLRLAFSKPVRREEVEQVLVGMQMMPVRGLMQWEDDKTLIWQIAQLPPRLDFLLDGAHDQDGLPLPGGIPSLRVGEAPKLVRVSPDSPADTIVAALPPDIISATRSRDGKAVNLMAWTPGTSRWDWRTADLYLELATGSLKSGRLEDQQLRIPGDLANWAISPPGTTLAGLRPAKSKATGKADLVITDLRGGRSQTYADFIDQEVAPGNGDFTTHLAWSADGRKLAAISFRGAGAGADIMALDLPSGQRSALVQNLPLASGAASLSWSGDGRYLQAGNLLVELPTGRIRSLEGDVNARGIWEPGGTRLLYNVRDWGPIMVVDPASSAGPKSLGVGLIVDWAGSGAVYLIRWGASGSRYVSPGL